MLAQYARLVRPHARKMLVPTIDDTDLAKPRAACATEFNSRSALTCPRRAERHSNVPDLFTEP